MLQEFLELLPNDPGASGLAIAITGSLIGAAIWLMGAPFSRPMITLLTVLLGAIIGHSLPDWFGWQVSGAGTAVGLSLAFGITGYAMHGMWVGIGLGTVLSTWAAIACWIAFRGKAEWSWPPIGADTTLAAYLSTVWQSLPADVSRVLPYGCASAMISGLAMAILWPRFSVLLGWSCAGATLLAGMGLAAVDYGNPQLLTSIPADKWAQASMLGMLVTVGMLIQWKLGPKPAASPAKKKPKDGEE